MVGLEGFDPPAHSLADCRLKSLGHLSIVLLSRTHRRLSRPSSAPATGYVNLPVETSGALSEPFNGPEPP
jgi:hypothetical protein